MYHKKVAQFIERLDEIEHELKSPESMKMSDINSWCRKILSYEEKIPIMKKHVFQVDLDFYEKKVTESDFSMHTNRFLQEMDLQEQAESRLYHFCLFIDEKINVAKTYVLDFEKSLDEYHELKSNVLKLSEMHWLHDLV